MIAAVCARARRRLPLALLCAIALCLPLRRAAAESGAHGPDDRHYAAQLEANAARLGLSEATMEQLRAIFAAADADRDALRTQLRAAHHAMRTLLSEPRPDDGAVMQQADVIGGLETVLLKQRLRALLRVRPLLTNAQLAELEKLRAERLAALSAACSNEIAGACPDAHGRGLIECLRRQDHQLSTTCRDGLSALRSP
ncbi:MAG: periplasmic heavy metal sensor [bacterium]